MLFKSSTPVVLKADEAQGIVTAIVNTTAGMPDKQNDVIVPGAWSKAIAALAKKSPTVCWHHENGLTSERFTPLGKVVGLKELMPGDPLLPYDLQQAGRGALIAEMQFNRQTTAGREAFASVASGDVSDWSVGFLPEVAEYNRDGGYNEIKSAFPLLEISPVLIGASPMTATLAVKSAKYDHDLNDLMMWAAVIAAR